MIKKVLTLGLMITFLAAQYGPLAMTNQANWQFRKEIHNNQPGFALVQIDTEVMGNCQTSFADLRVTDQAGKEIPSQVVQPGQDIVVQTVTLLNALRYPDHTSVMIDMGANPRPHNRLDLTIAMDKGDAYLREVEIQASNDAFNWGKLTTGKIMAYQYEQYNQINYPTSTMRYLKVDIKKQAGDSDLKVTSAQVLFLTGNIYVGNLLNTTIFSNRSDRTTTTIVIDMGVPSYMITEVQINTSNRNFDRNVTISTGDRPDVSGGESYLASERIIDYDWNNYQLTKDHVNVYQFSRRYLVISILNQDSPPLDIQSVQVFGAVPFVLADLAVPSLLWYGNPQATAPVYDLSQYSNLISKTDLPVTALGAQQVNPDYQPPVIPWTERNKWLLEALIVLTAAGFAWYIFTKLRQLASIHKGE